MASHVQPWSNGCTWSQPVDLGSLARITGWTEKPPSITPFHFRLSFTPIPNFFVEGVHGCCTRVLQKLQQVVGRGALQWQSTCCCLADFDVHCIVTTALIQGAPFKLLTSTHKLNPTYRVLLSGDAPAPMSLADFTGHVINTFTSLLADPFEK